MSDNKDAVWSPEHGWPQQPAPKKNEYPAVWDLVLQDLAASQFQNPVQASIKDLLVADIKRRDEAGEKKYGVRLQPFNGRNAIQDAYEEALDAIVYTRAAIFELEIEGGKIVTKETEFFRIGLMQTYTQFLDAALKLRFMLEKKKQEKENPNHESRIDTGDGRRFEEPRNHQSNLIIP